MTREKKLRESVNQSNTYPVKQEYLKSSKNLSKINLNIKVHLFQTSTVQILRYVHSNFTTFIVNVAEMAAANEKFVNKLRASALVTEN